MDDMPLIIKVAEVVFMEALVGVAVLALLITAVREIVDARVQESRRRDQIAMEPEGQTTPAVPATTEASQRGRLPHLEIGDQGRLGAGAEAGAGRGGRCGHRRA